MEIGPGLLGRCRIYGPTGSSSVLIDPRTQTGRLRNKFQQSDYKKVHSFDLNDLVVFAQETKMSLWFAWKANCTSTSSSPLNYTIYCFDEQPCAPPPRKVSDNFTDFVLNVALGNVLEKLKLRKFSISETSDKNDEDDEDWGDDDQKVEHKEEVQIARFFLPHSSGGY